MDNDDATSKTDAVARQKEEYSVATRFYQVMEQKLDQLRMRDDHSHFQLYEAEQRILLDVNVSGLVQGVAMGVATLTALRFVRSYLLRRVEHAIQKETTASTGSSSAKSGEATFRSPFQQKNPPSEGSPESVTTSTPLTVAEGVRDRRTMGWSGKLFYITSWLIDVAISLNIAAFVSMRNPEVPLKKLAALPLVEGRSTIADELCPDFLHELRDLQKGDNELQREVILNPQTVYLKAVLEFCNSCEQRRAYEKLLRQELGMPANEPVEIPPPGVPHNELGAADLSLRFEDSPQTDSDHDFYDPSKEMANSNPDWADSFVTDQEEQKKKDRWQD